MGERTGKIRYNLRDRGFKAFGNPRKFNVPLVKQIVNSEAVQEQIASRSLVGFYGHWPRVKFGAIAEEGGMDGKNQVNVEPAIVTVYAKAYDDGTIEHEQEFLDTDAGEKARKAYNSRVGGFSSVINEPRRIFGGMDYVFAPNYRDNRGYVLDSAHSQAHDALYGCLFDDAYGGMKPSMEEIDRYISLENQMALELALDNAHAERMQFNHAIEQLEAEREELLSLLAKANPHALATLDSATFGGYQGSSPFVYDSAHAAELREQTDAFLYADLPGFVAPPAKEEASAGKGIINTATDFARRTLLG